MTNPILTAALTAAGATLNRWRGASHPLKRFTPRPTSQILLALPYALACCPPAGSWWAVPVVLVLTTLAWLTGHGAYMSLGTVIKPISAERLDFLVWPFFGADPRVGATDLDVQARVLAYGPTKLYWRCVFGLAITGLAVTLPAGIVLANPALALSGALKAPAYMLASKWGTEGGEYLTGAFLFASLAFFLPL